MQDTALFTQLLGLCNPWKVTEVIPDLDNKSITVRMLLRLPPHWATPNNNKKLLDDAAY